MITLREAIEQGKIDQFIAEHKDEIGDEEAFNRALASMAGKSKEAPEALYTPYVLRMSRGYTPISNPAPIRNAARCVHVG